MLENKILKVINEIPDFPKPGISFKDITPLFASPTLVEEMLDYSVLGLKDLNIDLVAGIESRGFLLGVPLALRLQVPFVLIRKKGKLPKKTISQEYALEYGNATIEVQEGDIKQGKRVLIHDDLLATGGTAMAAAGLVQKAGGKVAGFHFLVYLSFLNSLTSVEQIAPVMKLTSFST